MPSNSDKEVGSKTVEGLTYLELRLLNVQREVGNHDLGFAAA
jgi:hypothetical protein